MAMKRPPKVEKPIPKEHEGLTTVAGKKPRAAPQKKRVKRPVGAPCMYTEKLGDLICEKLNNGQTLTSICKEDGMPTFGTVMDWAEDIIEVNGVHTYKFAIFSKKFARARIRQAEYSVTEVSDLIDDAGVWLRNPKTGKVVKDENGRGVRVLTHESVAHVKAQANHRQWLAERVSERFVPRTKQELTGANGGPLQTANLNANANYDPSELEDAFKSLLSKGV